MNIVDAVKNQLSGEVLGRLSSAIGESEEKTRIAAGAAVPSVLSLLANSVLGGKGLDGLVDALRNYEGTDPMARLRTSPDAGEAAAAPPSGDVLGSLLGPNLSTLLNLLSKFAGIGLPALKSLMSFVGPLILSTLASQLKGRGGITPANLTSFFTAEKANISKALPAGLSLADLASIPGVSTPGTTSRPSVATTPAADSGMPSWLLPVLALGLLGLGAWYFLREPQEAPAPGPVAEAPGGPPVEGAPASPAAVDESTMMPTADEVSKGLNEVYTGAAQTLAEVKDAATAEAALPKLSAFDTRVDVLKTLWDKIPAEAKAAVLKATAEHLDALKALVPKVLEIPGVGEKLKPVLDGLLAKIASMSA